MGIISQTILCKINKEPIIVIIKFIYSGAIECPISLFFVCYQRIYTEDNFYDL